MVTIFNCYRLLNPIGVASFDFRDNRPEIILASCLALLVSYSVVQWASIIAPLDESCAKGRPALFQGP